MKDGRARGGIRREKQKGSGVRDRGYYNGEYYGHLVTFVLALAIVPRQKMANPRERFHCPVRTSRQRGTARRAARMSATLEAKLSPLGSCCGAGECDTRTLALREALRGNLRRAPRKRERARVTI